MDELERAKGGRDEDEDEEDDVNRMINQQADMSERACKTMEVHR